MSCGKMWEMSLPSFFACAVIYKFIPVALALNYSLQAVMKKTDSHEKNSA